MDLDLFVEHPKSEDQNSVWRFFLTNKYQNKGKCIKCLRVIKAENKSTSGLYNHMKLIHKHDETSLKRQSNQETSSSDKKITTFFRNTEVDTLDQVLARMASLDGIRFQLFCTSEDIRKGLAARGFKDIPKSPNTIRKRVLRYAEKIRNETIEQFHKLKSEGNKFSVTSDEWTSIRNRRFINVNLHSKDETWNLGLGRAFGKLPAEKVCINHTGSLLTAVFDYCLSHFLQIVKLIDERLHRFHLETKAHIVNLTTDGPKVMKKVGRLFDAEHQLCIVHGLQLAVVEVLYKKQPEEDSEADCEEAVIDIAEDDDEYGDESESLIIDDNNTEPNELTNDFSILELIQKIRIVVKLFRRSPTKNDEVLQKYVIEEFKEDFSLILDCKTRWSSLLAMIKRFDKLQNCVRKALIDLKSDIVFSDEELKTVKTLIEILLPVKLAVEALCREDANLLTAITTLEFLLANIGSGSVLHDKMKSALERRISERLTNLANVLQYLHSGTFVNSNLGIRKMSKDILVKTIIRLLNQPETEEENALPEKDLNNVADSETPVLYGPVTLKQQLQKAIGKRKSSDLHNYFQLRIFAIFYR